MSATYCLFHAWLAKCRGKIVAGKDRTVIYSGIDSGGVPLYKRLAEHEKFLRDEYGVDPKWQPIESVLRNLTVDWKTHQGALEFPKPVLVLRNLWDFAVNAGQADRTLTTQESQQIWKNLSAWYVKNATGKIYIFEGDKLKKYPDMLLAEIPVVLKNKNIKMSAATEAKMIKLIPDSQAAWDRYRADTAKGREAGR